VLLLLVVLAPLLVDLDITIPRLGLFASDIVVRRSAIAGSIGLIVTAFVFFRPRPQSNHESTKERKHERGT
jgi:hypothetical protein